MRDIALTAFVLGTIPFIFYRPYIGILVWSWLSYMTPGRFTWSFAYDFRFAMIIAAVTLVAWVLSRDSKSLPWNGVTQLLFAFWAWTTLTTTFALYDSYALAEWQDVSKNIVMNGFATMALCASRARVNALIWVIVLSIGFYGVKGGLFTLITGGAYHVYGAPNTYFGSNNYLAAALLITIPFMRYLQLTTDQRIIRWGLIFAMLLCVVSVLGSQSRGGFVGLIFLSFALIMRTRRKFYLSIAFAFCLAFGFQFMPQSWHDRMATILAEEQDASIEGRFEAWKYAQNLASERPFVGGGFAAFRGNEAGTKVGYRSAHSIYFQTLGEHGYIGLGLYLITGISVAFLCSSIVRRTRFSKNLTWAHDLARMLQVSLFTFAVVGLFSNIAYFEILFHVAALSVLTDRLVRNEVAERHQKHQPEAFEDAKFPKQASGSEHNPRVPRNLR